LNASNVVRQAGIRLSAYLIAGVFEDEDADISATAKLLEKIRPVDGHVSPLVYYPGTPLFEDAVKRGKVPDDIFERQRDTSFPVIPSGASSKSIQKLLTILRKTGDRSGFLLKEIKQQKKDIGYCHATNLLMGEYYETMGELSLAEGEYREIVTREPENPWGWLALGEMFAESGDLAQSRQAFEELCRLVPSHVPGYEARAELCRLSGDRKGAQENLRTVDKLIRGAVQVERQ
jgi:tetratricopeptide (TPR) repeat protein